MDLPWVKTHLLLSPYVEQAIAKGWRDTSTVRFGNGFKTIV
ncbi:hypothetical protein BLGI_1377 [Brevibacillus laterosporus GI-9]|nr:hypothetical protein BLGI_1377 [Brevibacillus laterosporus GI-9]